MAAGAGAARPWDGGGAARCGALLEVRLLWRGMAGTRKIEASTRENRAWAEQAEEDA